MRRAWSAAIFLLVLWAGPVAAHSPVPGIKGFYIGLLHPFSTPPQALMMIGLGLLVGAFSVKKVQWLLGSFALASLVGLLLGQSSVNLDTALFALAFCTFAFAALAPGKIAALAIVLTAIGGFLIGEASIPDAGPARDRFFTMSGSIVGANIGLLYLWGITRGLRERFTQEWVAIALRVVAAWGGAISLLMFALGFAAVTP